VEATPGDGARWEIRRGLSRLSQRFISCLEENTPWPHVDPMIEVSLVVAPDGRLLSASTSGATSPYASCVLAVVRGVTFTIDAADEVHLTYPVHFDYSPY
jgi:hypothetical protein